MRNAPIVLLMLVIALGCAQSPNWTAPEWPAPASVHQNPLLVPITNHEYVWDAVVDVVGDYFRVDREDPVRLLGNTLTEGRIETYPKTGATIFEPWDNDSANQVERMESTLQSIRRRAIVRVIPVQGGFWVDMAVFKELENLPQPEHSTAGAATFRYDTSLTRVINPATASSANQGWIPQGRDGALEQRMLGQLQYRLSALGRPVPLQ